MKTHNQNTAAIEAATRMLLADGVPAEEIAAHIEQWSKEIRGMSGVKTPEKEESTAGCVNTLPHVWRIESGTWRKPKPREDLVSELVRQAREANHDALERRNRGHDWGHGFYRGRMSAFMSAAFMLKDLSRAKFREKNGAAPHPKTPAQEEPGDASGIGSLPTQSEAPGMTWWNGLTRPEREEVLRQTEQRVGASQCTAATAWKLWQGGNISMAERVSRACASCQKEFGVRPVAGTSHGLCQRHLVEQWQCLIGMVKKQNGPATRVAEYHAKISEILARSAEEFPEDLGVAALKRRAA